MAQIHVVEFLSEVPARCICAANGVLHDAGCADGFGSDKDFFVRCRNFQTDFFQNVSAIRQGLRVCHEGHSHDFAAHRDQLLLWDVLAVFGDKSIKWLDYIFVD